ncbi:MAG: LysR family transcriptional regulator, partial [Pseudomonadota bacterium]
MTARLQSLEEALGTTLLLRHKRGITLTAAGVKFKRYAEAMLDLWWQVEI